MVPVVVAIWVPAPPFHSSFSLFDLKGSHRFLSPPPCFHWYFGRPVGGVGIVVRARLADWEVAEDSNGDFGGPPGGSIAVAGQFIHLLLLGNLCLGCCWVAVWVGCLTWC